MSGPKLRISRRAATKLFGRTTTPRARAARDMFTSPADSMSESSKPACGTSRVSKPLAVPTNRTTESGSRRMISFATAMPG
jgi:hypothetical protein